MKNDGYIRLGVQFKVAATVVVASTLSAAVLVYSFRQQMAASLETAMQERAAAIATGLANECEYGLIVGNRALLQQATSKTLAQADVVSAVVFDENGDLMAGAGKLDSAAKSKFGPELVARFTKPGVTEVLPGPGASRVRTFYLPVHVQPMSSGPADEFSTGTPTQVGHRLGLIELAVSSAGMSLTLYKAELIALGIGAAAAMLVSLLCVMVVRRTIRPLSTLVAGTDQLATGNLGARVDIGEGDEIGDLAQSFNKMAESLQRSQAEILDHQRNLEQRVKRRTIELEEEIAERTLSEKAWRESEERYRRLVEQFPDAIAVHVEERWAFMNSAGVRLLGAKTAEELIGKPVMDSVPDERQRFVRERVRLVIETGQEIHGVEEKLLRLDGSLVDVEITAAPLAFKGKAAVQVVIRDITERKQAEGQLRESNRLLRKALAELQTAEQRVIGQERLRALGNMASGVAHDFNNSLMAILGFSELLLNQPDCLKDKRKTQRYLKMLNTAAKDAGQIVNRLREFYRHREKGDVLTQVDLNELIDEAILLTEPKWKTQAQASGISITVEKNLQDIPTIVGNATGLREILTNLIFNSVDAMPRGGRITVRTRIEGNQVGMEICDTGTGMTREVRTRCLEPFFTTKGERGTGLGLSVVYGIVQRHEGSVEIQSEVGRGTTFVIRLPIRANTAEVDTDPVPRTSPAGQLRLLVVDDEAMIRDVEAEYLEADGHIVTRAESGRAGLERFRAEKFDAVVLDRAMPEMSGDQLASAVKQLSPNTPVIMLTGFGDLMEATGEKPDHVDILLSKPITLAGLQEAVRKSAGLPCQPVAS